MKKRIFLVFLLICTLSKGWAQTESLEKYKEEIPFFQELITGGQYPDPPSNYEGSPYLGSKSFELGALRINQISYPDVLLLYDIRYDQLITFHPVFSERLLINPVKIQAFSLSEASRFRHLTGNESYLYNGNGFYEILEEGKVSLVSKHYKTVRKAKEVGAYAASYEEFEDFFLILEGEFIPVKTKKQAIKALGVSKKNVREELIKNRIYFNQDKRAFLKGLLRLSNSSTSL